VPYLLHHGSPTCVMLHDLWPSMWHMR